MYELPANFDFEQFRSKSLDLVCFEAYKVHLHLSGGYLIGVEGSISIDSDEGVALPEMLPLLYPLINQEITGASRNGSGTLSLKFNKGTTLHIHDSSKQFECYSISLKGETLAIV